MRPCDNGLAVVGAADAAVVGISVGGMLGVTEGS